MMRQLSVQSNPVLHVNNLWLIANSTDMLCLAQGIHLPVVLLL